MDDKPTLPIAPSCRFAGKDPATLAEVGRLVMGVQDMVWKQVRLVFHSTPRADQEDYAARCMAHLATYSAARYDPSKSKWSTFAQTCIRNYVNSMVPNRQSKQPAPSRVFKDITLHEPAAPDASTDRSIEAFAQSICEFPERYGLTPASARLLRAFRAAPQELEMKQLATQLGYASGVVLARAIQRLRARIIEQFEQSAF